jgi:hypothetical protein
LFHSGKKLEKISIEEGVLRVEGAILGFLRGF